ncbi:MAG: hypothetical protein RH917_18025 [Lacipirellulaceae bacterium]
MSCKVFQLLFATFLVFGVAKCVHAAPKVGSPEWKREHERKMAEHKQKMAEHKRKFSSSSSSSRSFEKGAAAARKRYEKFHAELERERAAKAARQPVAPKFNAAAAPSPLHCLLAFRKAASRATSAEQLLPYRAKVLRDNYRTSQSWGSDYDHLQHDKDMLLGIVRIDDIRINDDIAKIQVVNRCKLGSYTEGTFTMKGEGNRWRMEAYTSGNLFYSRLPNPPKHKSREKRDFPIYVENYLARLKSADGQQLPQDQQQEESEPTVPEPPEPQPES